MYQLDQAKQSCQQLMNQDAARREAAENIARLSLREANDIINTANKNADIIIREALATARGILEDLSTLYDQAGSVKEETSEKLKKVLDDLEDFRLPEMPDLMWLKDAEERLR